MKIIYLQKRLSVTGRNCFIGRRLYDKLKLMSSEILLGHAIVDNENFKNSDGDIKRDLIPLKILKEISPDVIYLEGGILASEKMWKIEQNIAEPLVQDGAVLVINDIDINDVKKDSEEYSKIFNFVKTYIQFGNNNIPIYCADQHISPAEMICYTKKMGISDWLKPIYEGVEEIIVSWPMRINTYDSILASGNRGSTGTLSSDVWVDEHDWCPFSSVVQVGCGYIVLIAGQTTFWSEKHDGNLLWLSNLIDFLHKEAKKNKNRAISHYYSKYSLFLSHRSTDKKIVENVVHVIKDAGIGIWLDQEKMLPSDSLTQKISEGLSTMTHFILFWSKACLESGWVERELNSAIAQMIELKKPIILIRLDDTSVPIITSDLYRIEARELSEYDIGKLIADTVNKLEKRSV